MISAIEWSRLAALSPLLAALPSPSRKAARLLQVEVDGLLFATGDKPKSMYYVVSGEVRLLRRTQTGGEIVLQRTRRGFVAEASIDQLAYHCDAVAPVLSTALVIPRNAFSSALKDEKFRGLWISLLSRELRRVRGQNERLHLHRAQDRIVHFVLAETADGCLQLDQSKKQWAAELGLTHEALYRALSALRRQQRIEVDGNVLRVIDRPGAA